MDTICSFQVSICSFQVSIAAIAQKYAQMGSTKWSKDSDIWPGRGEDKCNIFVADVVIEAGGSVPMR